MKTSIKVDKVNDFVYGNVTLSPLVSRIVKLPEFTRLNEIKQLGCHCYINSKADHTRYEHSIGVYHLANTLINQLKKVQPELKITKSEIKCVGLAGLLHDIGHGPFSHLFDEWLETSMEINNNVSYHEQRSGDIIEYLNKTYKFGLEPKEISMIRSMIDPIKIPKSRRFLYQIVANKDNNLDVDKIDYLKRDGKILKSQFNRYINVDTMINGFRVRDHNLVIDQSNYMNVLNVFTLRYMFHREFYNSSTAKAVDLIMKKIFTILNKDDWLTNKVKSVQQFLTLTDSVLIDKILNNEEAVKLYGTILSKNWRKAVAKIRVSPFIDTTKLKSKLANLEKDYDNTKIVVTKIGLVSGDKKNPLSCIRFFNKDEETELFRLNNFVLFKEYYQETLVYVYCDTNDIKCNKSVLNQVYGIIEDMLESVKGRDRTISEMDSMLI